MEAYANWVGKRLPNEWEWQVSLKKRRKEKQNRKEKEEEKKKKKNEKRKNEKQKEKDLLDITDMEAYMLTGLERDCRMNGSGCLKEKFFIFFQFLILVYLFSYVSFCSMLHKDN